MLVAALRAGLLATLLLAGAARADEVKIGVVLGESEGMQDVVAPMIDAMRLAADQINAQGGVLDGRRLALIFAGTGGGPQAAVDAARRLAKAEQVSALIGGLTSATTLALTTNVAVPEDLLQISPSATAPELTRVEDKDLFFRLVPSDDYQAAVLAKLAYNQGYDRVALAYVDDLYGANVARIFRGAYAGLGGRITAEAPHPPDRRDFAGDLKRLATGRPKALVIVAYPETGIPLIRQALAAGLSADIIGTDTLIDSRLIEEVGADRLRNAFFTAPAVLGDSPGARRFADAYAQAYGPLGASLFVAQAYDAVMLAAMAMERAGSPHEPNLGTWLRRICCTPGRQIGPGEWARAKALIAAGTKINYEGASGPVEFDGNGDVEGLMGWFDVENGAFKQLGVVKR
jgi:branched-chain amino acid transport system substrate-binding protein